MVQITLEEYCTGIVKLTYTTNIWISLASSADGLCLVSYFFLELLLTIFFCKLLVFFPQTKGNNLTFLSNFIGINVTAHKKVSGMVEFLTLPGTGSSSCRPCPEGLSLLCANGQKHAI